jgi:hypothetical protein
MFTPSHTDRTRTHYAADDTARAYRHGDDVHHPGLRHRRSVSDGHSRRLSSPKHTKRSVTSCSPSRTSSSEKKSFTMKTYEERMMNTKQSKSELREPKGKKHDQDVHNTSTRAEVVRGWVCVCLGLSTLLCMHIMVLGVGFRHPGELLCVCLFMDMAALSLLFCQPFSRIAQGPPEPPPGTSDSSLGCSTKCSWDRKVSAFGNLATLLVVGSDVDDFLAF